MPAYIAPLPSYEVTWWGKCLRDDCDSDAKWGRNQKGKGVGDPGVYCEVHNPRPDMQIG